MCQIMDLEIQAEKFKRNKHPVKHKFDFDAGFLTQSPCKECGTRAHIPACINNCNILGKIHSHLVNVISSSRRS